MNKAVCEITHLIWVNTLSEFMMINGNTMNTTVHNNDFQHLIKNIINILYTQTSSTTLEKFNETIWASHGKWGYGTQQYPLSGDRGLYSIHECVTFAFLRGNGAVGELQKEKWLSQEIA